MELQSNIIKPPNRTSVKLQTLIHCIITNNVKDLNRLIIHHYSSSVLLEDDINGKNCLHYAVDTAVPLLVENLLRFGVIDVNKLALRYAGGFAPIHIACIVNNKVTNLAK